MEMKIEEKNKKYWIVELKGEDQTIPNLLVNELLKDRDVLFASYVLEHPQVSSPKIIIKTRQRTAATALKKAIERAEEKLTGFKKLLRKL